MSRKRILLVWNYDRMDWIKPFLDLKDQFHFIFLGKYTEGNDKTAANIAGIDRIYWDNFSSPGEIIKHTRPDAIVFMSINNFMDIILNSVAQKKGINTAILQHGLFYSQETYRERLKLLSGKARPVETDINGSAYWKIRYFLGGLAQGFGIRSGRDLFRYLKQKQSSGDIIALENNKFSARIPGRFIVYSKNNAIIYKERDGASDSDMVAIGNPTMDKYFETGSPNELPFDNYFLLVDSPLHVEKSVSSGFGFSKQKALDVYQRIVSYVQARGKKLVIKLHPFSYNEDDLIKDPGVIYTRDEYDPRDLIAGADAVISFPSTLAIPAIYFKPVILLKFSENSFLDFISQSGLPVISIDDISASSPDPVWNETGRKFVVEECLFEPDGQSLQRLRNELVELCGRK